MVYGFAKQFGGTVTIESEPGAGTTVKLYLPRSLAQDGNVAMDGEVAAYPAATTTRH